LLCVQQWFYIGSFDKPRRLNVLFGVQHGEQKCPIETFEGKVQVLQT
jgi:hypothetical protein